ncbi:MAG TPA: hypothetical protein VG013_14880 [Gemmataceae bacterium]|jgi:type II secretory pathway component GspD/PulD (secretin)|nr:hypothetical protein [Gemmataceae bacterium]
MGHVTKPVMRWLPATGLSLFVFAVGCAGDRALSWRAQHALGGPHPCAAQPSAAVDAVTSDAPSQGAAAQFQAAGPAPPPAGPVTIAPAPALLSPGILQSKAEVTAVHAKAEGRENLPPPRKVPTDGPATTADGDRLHIKDLDVRDALHMVSLAIPLNIVISPEVGGIITADLQGLSPEETLQAIVKVAHLVAERDQGVVYVYTVAEMAKAAEWERRLPIRVYHLNYIRSTDLERMVQPLLTPKLGKITSSPTNEAGIHTSPVSGGSTPVGVAQPAGNAQPAGGTQPVSNGQPAGAQGTTGGNALAGDDVVIVQDQEAVLQNIDRIVAQVDVQPPQVVIDVKIMSVELDKTHELGVNFGVLDSSLGLLGVVGNGSLLNAAAGFTPAGVVSAGGQVAGGSTGGQVAGGSTGFAENSHGLKLGVVNKNVTGFIKALDTIGKTEVLACPQLTVLNKQEGEFQLGDRLGYRTLTQNGTSTIESIDFLNVGTLLHVRPFIYSNGTIRMLIHPERSTGQVVNDIPQSNTSEVTTQVIVPDGMTIVIGGLMENEDDDHRSGVPGLMNLRWIGALFRQHTQSSTKKELIVLLTPRIWNPQVLPGPVPPASCPVPPSPVVQTAVSEPVPAEPQPPCVQLYLRQSPEPVRVSEEAVYEIVVVNAGPKALQGVALSAALAPGLQAQGTEGPTGAQISDHRVVYQLLAELAPQAQTVYRIRARATAAGPQSIQVQLSSLSLPSSHHAEHETTVLAAAPVPLGPPQAVWRKAASSPFSH